MKIPVRFIITRQELYDLVWSKQFGPAAAELGIRKVELRGLCLWNKVPRPSSLFWRHKAIGKPEDPKPLPNPEKNPEIEIQPGLLRVEDPSLRKEAVLQMIRIGASNLFTVREDLRGCHKLVVRTRSKRIPSTKQNMLDTPEIQGSLAIGVSTPNIRRALLLFDAILKGFEGLGYWVGFTDDHRKRTVIEVMGLQIQVSIREYDSIRVLEKKRDEHLYAEYGIEKERKRIELVPSGRLRVEIYYSEQGFYGKNTCYQHEQISETKATPMEKRLKQVAFAVIAAAAQAIEQKAWRKKREEEEWEARKRKEEEERRRAARWEKIQIEQARVDALIDESEDWAKSNRLRDYINVKEADYLSRGVNIGPKSDAGKWLKWASDQADRLDPLAKSPPSILDDEDEYSP